MIDVVALGELLIDFAAKSTDTSGYPTMAANPGGAPGNFLAALNAYGKKTAFLGKVGNDAFGHLLLGTLKAAGIETKSVVVDDSVFTTLAFVTFDENGDRSFSFARKPGADTQLTWEEIDKSLIDDARVFHFGTLSLTDEPVRTATQRAVAYAKEKGKLITCDPNLRKPLWPSEDAAREQMLWSLRQADVVKISDNEVEFLWNCTPEEGADKLLKEFGVSLALVTLGPEGCLLKTENASFRAVCPKVHPIDTTGAGDIFGGSALSRLLELEKPIPFDFVINGTLLRVSLTEYISSHGLSLESTLELEYIPIIGKPEEKSNEDLPDWVGGLACNKEYYVAGCYDGSLHMFGNEDQLITTLNAHTKPIKSVDVQKFNNVTYIASTSLDNSMRLFRLENDALQSVGVCSGHDSHVMCCKIHAANGLVASGAWNGSILVWDLSSLSPEKEPEPVHTLSESMLGVTALEWSDEHVVSGGWDHVIRIWDLEAEGVITDMVVMSVCDDE